MSSETHPSPPATLPVAADGRPTLGGPCDGPHRDGPAGRAGPSRRPAGEAGPLGRGRHVHVGRGLAAPAPHADAVHTAADDRRRAAAALVAGLAAHGAAEQTWWPGRTRASRSLRAAGDVTLHLHLHEAEDLRRATPLGLAARGPLVVHLHEGPGRASLTGTADRRAVATRLRPLLRRARLVVVPSTSARRRAADLGARHAVTPTPAALAPARRLPADPARPAPWLGRRLVVLAPFPPDRELLDLVEVLAAQPPDVGLVLLGEGVDERRLRGAARRLGLGPRIHVRARPNYAELDAHLRHADVVASLAAEGGDLGLVRAMALGRPILGAATLDRRRLVSSGLDGLLVPLGQRWGLAAGLHRLLTDRPLATELAAAAARRAAARSWADVGAEILHALARR